MYPCVLLSESPLVAQQVELVFDFWGRGGGLLLVCGERFVPVVLRRMQTLYRRVEGDHPAAGPFARLVGIEAAVDLIAAIQERIQPRRRRANTGG